MEEEDAIPRTYDLHPPEYYVYELVGVVVHSGTAESGHYYSFIKDRGDYASRLESKDNAAIPGKWFEFNDKVVEPFDMEDLASETFGGVEQEQEFDKQSGQVVLVDKPIKRNAYMLVYERKHPLPEEPEESDGTPGAAPKPASPTSTADVKGESKEEPPPVELTDDLYVKDWRHHVMPRDVANEVWQDNLRFLASQLVYDGLFPRFMLHHAKRMCDLFPATEDPKSKEGAAAAGNAMVLLHYGTQVLSRGTDVSLYPDYIKVLCRCLKSNVVFALRFLRYIIDHQAMVEVRVASALLI